VGSSELISLRQLGQRMDFLPDVIENLLMNLRAASCCLFRHSGVRTSSSYLFNGLINNIGESCKEKYWPG
jgi:hypothetical protein